MAKNIEDLTVFVAHESKQMRGLIRQKLSGLGVNTIVEASELEMAFGTFKLNRVDLIISDFGGDKLDGLDLTKKIREIEESPKKAVPIILVTLENSNDVVSEAIGSGATTLLTVNFDAKALYASIKAAFGKSGITVESSKYVGPDRRDDDNRPTHNREHRRQAILDSFLVDSGPKDAAE